MALPDFGLMTKADKLKLDGIDTTTLLTKTEAAATYATKAEVREYIRQVVESDTGFVLLNGNGSEVGVISAMAASLQLSVSPTEADMTDSRSTQDFTVTTNSSGAITAELIGEEADIYFNGVEINGNTITVTRSREVAVDDETYTLRITVAADDTYPTGTVDVAITVIGENSGFYEP